jgi:catechol 2,3-dioxygenase-like lactoylglutathione lyase family enzyme
MTETGSTLRSGTVGPVIPVSDLDASVAFDCTALGLDGESAPGGFALRAGGDTRVYLLPSTDYPGQADWPLASFQVADIDFAVADLRRRGVRTEVDVPYSVGENGIADVDGMRIAWLRDPDGQVLSIFQLTAG